MAAFTFNVAKGRTIAYHDRVDTSDPTNAVLVLVVLAATGLESDDLLKDYNDLAALLAGASNEVTNTNYARKVLSDADIAVATVDDSNDWATATFSSQTFTSIAAGDSWSKLIVCYDPDSTGGTDSALIPLTGHDLRINGSVIIPSGGNIVISAPSGYVRAR